MRKVNLVIKRIIDLLGSFSGLIILSPLIILISLAIKLDSNGPVIFKQERIGVKGKHFHIIKFRTMVNNAEYIGDGLIVRSESDSRITRIGKILRRTSLDEILQLYNVLIGQMSLVGPRPPVVYHPYNDYFHYPDWAKKRFEMRPGITGLSQATVRASLPWDDRLRIDVEYVNSFLVFLDIKILILTVKQVVFSKGIYL